MASDVTAEEVFRLARAMTFKNSAAGIPHGGGKSGILADPKTENKETIIRLFAQAIKELVMYILVQTWGQMKRPWQLYIMRLRGLLEGQRK